MKHLTKKVLWASLPRNIIRNTFEKFNKTKDDLIISEQLFDEQKLLLRNYCFQNQKKKLPKAL